MIYMIIIIMFIEMYRKILLQIEHIYRSYTEFSLWQVSQLGRCAVNTWQDFHGHFTNARIQIATMYYVKDALWRVQVFVNMVSVAMDLTEMITSKHAESDQQQQGRRHKSEAQSRRKNRMKLQMNQLATICAAQPCTIQKISLMLRIPQIEDLFVLSPDVDPHKNALIKVFFFKPSHAHAEGFEQGDPTDLYEQLYNCLLYTSPSPRDKRQSRMPSSA